MDINLHNVTKVRLVSHTETATTVEVEYLPHGGPTSTMEITLFYDQKCGSVPLILARE